MKKIFFISVVLLQITACTPEIGSESWCADLKEKPKADWSINEASDYTKHCLFK